MPSNGSSSFPQSQTQAYGWRRFLLEFLYGLLAIVWYLLLLAEGSVRRGLTWLARLGDLPSGDPSENSGERSVLSDEAESSFGLQCKETHASEFESARHDKSQPANRRSASLHHISWTVIFVGLNGLTLRPYQSQAVHARLTSGKWDSIPPSSFKDSQLCNYDAITSGIASSASEQNIVVRTTLQGSRPTCVREDSTFDKGH
jgi:hypothetical protein